MKKFFEKAVVSGVAASVVLWSYPMTALGAHVNAAQEEDFGEEMQGPDERQMLAQAKRQLQPAISGLRQVEAMVKKIGGANVPDEVKENISQVKQIIAAAQAATSIDEFESSGVEEIQSLLETVTQFQQEYMENEMRLREVRQRLKGAEQGIKEIDRVLATLKKQKIGIPDNFSEKVGKLKSILAAVKVAKTWQEVEEAGIEELRDMFDSFEEDLRSLEILARWPKTLQQVDRELKRIEAELKRDKTISANLAKKGLDLSEEYSQFEEAVAKLKEARAQAVSKMKEGDAEGAFDLIEEGFFDSMEKAWSHHEVFMTISNLGRFASELKRGLAEAKGVINQLKKQKIDVSDLQELYEKAKAVGDEVLAKIKARPLDLEDVFGSMQELDEISDQFDELAVELGGDEFAQDQEGPEEKMPWEEGPAVFKPGVMENLGGLFGGR